MAYEATAFAQQEVFVTDIKTPIWQTQYEVKITLIGVIGEVGVEIMMLCHQPSIVDSS